jgi:hypothetical protein
MRWLFVVVLAACTPSRPARTATAATPGCASPNVPKDDEKIEHLLIEEPEVLAKLCGKQPTDVIDFDTEWLAVFRPVIMGGSLRVIALHDDGDTLTLTLAHHYYCGGTPPPREVEHFFFRVPPKERKLATRIEPEANQPPCSPNIP